MTVHEVLSTGFFWHVITIAIIVAFWCGHSFGSIRETVEPQSQFISATRQSGVVKWFNDAKGFGFITPESGEDLMVHFRSIEGTGFKSLMEGQAVTFITKMGTHGLQADSVRLQGMIG